MASLPDQPATIFVVDDDLGLLRLIERALKRVGHATASASSGREAIDWLLRHRPQLLLLDLKLRDLEARELINHLESLARPVPFIVITGQGDERVAVEMMKRGALDYLVKDAKFLDLLPAGVQRALAQIERERRLAATEDALRRIEALLAKAQQIAHLGSYEINAGTPPQIYWSDQMYRIHGLEPGDARPLSVEFFDRHVHPDDRDHVRATIKECLRSARGWQIEYRIVRADGGVRRVQSWSEAVGGGADATRIVGTLLDITERRELEQQILHISEQERERIGQDLHDGICQQLAGIGLMCDVLGQTLAGRSRPGAEQAAVIAGKVREIIGQTRRLSRGLCPVVIESEGLMAALRELAESTEMMFKVKCRFRCDTPAHIQEHQVAVHLYRIAQEAVSNALRHGRAKRIEIVLASTPERLSLMVHDDGAGLPDDAHKRNGMGLRIMQYRAGMIGGTLVVQKSPKGGTTVACTVVNQTAPKPVS
jgi:PAS domain S-box-containing protein